MRRMTLVLGLAVALALTAAGGTADGQDKTKPDAHHAMHDKCAAACGQCALACDSCGAHCAKMLADGKKEHLNTLQTCQDCASVCAAAACIVGRHGPFSDTICKSCAEACNRCGKECDKFKDDPQMKKCADECKKCEQACREMLEHRPTGVGDRVDDK